VADDDLAGHVVGCLGRNGERQRAQEGSQNQKEASRHWVTVPSAVYERSNNPRRRKL
jgi:hypothetical protein